ncbi:MAG: DUF2339 domain-containing protein, partial [Pseudomonadota bacterium]
AGLLTDVARVGLAGVFGAALIAGGARLERSNLPAAWSGAARTLPNIFVAAGLTVLNGAVFAAGAYYGIISPLLALSSYLAVAALAVALSMRFGRLVAAIGLVGAYFGPLFTGASGGSVSLLLAYSAAITAGALTLIRLRGWPRLLPIAVIGASFWGLAGLSDEEPAFAIPVYALALAATGVFFGMRAAAVRVEVDLSKPSRILKTLVAEHASLGAAFLFALLGGGLIWLDVLGGVSGSTLGGLLLFCGGSLVVAWLRPGYGLLAPMGSAIAIASLLVWPETGSSLIALVIAIAIGFGGLGTYFVLRPQGAENGSPSLAVAAALTPPAALFVPISGLFHGASGFWWGYAAAACAVGYIAVLEALKNRSDGFEGAPLTGAAFALGAFLSAVLVPFAFLEGLWLGGAFAVLSLGICVVQARFQLRVLEILGPFAVAGAVTLLMRPGFLSGSEISAVPIFNELLFGYGAAIAALGAGAWMMRRSMPLRRANLAGALVLGFGLLGLEIRHLAQGGDLFVPGLSLGEVSGYAITYLGLAVSFAWRLSSHSFLFRLAERIGAGIGAGASVAALFILASEPAIGLPIFNLLFVSFAMPGLLMAAYA